jgi:hypothetical protein
MGNAPRKTVPGQKSRGRIRNISKQERLLCCIKVNATVRHLVLTHYILKILHVDANGWNFLKRKLIIVTYRLTAGQRSDKHIPEVNSQQ